MQNNEINLNENLIIYTHTTINLDFFNPAMEHLRPLMCAELAGDFHLGDSRQLTDKSLLPFDLVS